MKQEDKELLLKDLCARLPYGVKCKYYDCCEGDYGEGTICGFERQEYIQIDGVCIHIEEVKPYLYPLSSMTKEQFNELKKLGYLENCVYCREIPFKLKWIKTFSLPLLRWLLENHFDINGLIEKELAVDATGLNIY